MALLIRLVFYFSSKNTEFFAEALKMAVFNQTKLRKHKNKNEKMVCRQEGEENSSKSR